MRFGLVTLNDGAFHTFHLHGHRWVVQGPDGLAPYMYLFGPQVRAVSQFEDTRMFGPANSFYFTIQHDFLRPLVPRGEWPMHCHVLGHMAHGMMGSLLVVDEGQLARPFQRERSAIR
jgi:FtsP/CotA-like multicopper oxidase with cupredoxin domain